MSDTVVKSKRDWFIRKVEIADNVFSTYGFDGESDAEVLLCCATSAIASKMWPGDGIDRGRFTEFLIRFIPSGIDVQRISIPVLIAKLKGRNFFAEAKVLMAGYPLSDFGEVITCDNIDQSEDTVVNLCPGIDTKVIRDASHVGIIYKDLRCGLVHEGRVSRAMFHDFQSETEIPYYANILRDLDSPLEHPICFPYGYIRNILVTAVENAISYRSTVKSWVIEQPSKWWIEGE